MNKGSNELSPREMQQYVWCYFELHANQRMSVFRFFIGLATFLTASLLTAAVQQHDVAGAVLGALLGLVSFVFWRLDERTCFLIRDLNAHWRDSRRPSSAMMQKVHDACNCSERRG